MVKFFSCFGTQNKKNLGSSLLEMTRANEFKQFDELSICKKLRSILAVRRPRTIEWSVGN
jgi:hypothetical protein